MAKSLTRIHTAHVAEPQAEDSQVIKELHDLGRAFTMATGAYMADNPSVFPQGTLSQKESKRDKEIRNGLVDAQASVQQKGDLSHTEMEDHIRYYATHLHCMFMKSEELYLEDLHVPFNAIADGLDIDVSDEADVSRKLEVCQRYGFTPIAQLLQRKLDTV